MPWHRLEIDASLSTNPLTADFEICGAVEFIRWLHVSFLSGLVENLVAPLLGFPIGTFGNGKADANWL